MNARCAQCERKFEPVDRPHWQAHQRDRFCSDQCKSTWGRNYDQFVDPTGFYQAKATDPHE